jgi:hypothetical protein
MRRQLQRLPSRDPNDPNFWRLHYIRYADDLAIGLQVLGQQDLVTGPRL